MKDEIKEILDFDFESQGERIEINEYERNILKDYITNLQEKYDIVQKDIETLTNNYNDLVKMSENKITNLQEEINKLIAESTEWEERTYCWQDHSEDLQITIDKASDFIKEKINSTQGVINDYMYHKEHNQHLIELLREDIEMYKKELNILKGSEENE